MNKNIVILVGVAVLAGLAYMFVGQDKGGMQSAEGPKIGIILGYTGPIESLTPDMALGAEMAIKEANDSGNFKLGTATSVRADSTCIDSAAATAAAERLVTSDKVAAMVGADCSGVTTAILENVAVPNGVVMISPSATSPALSTVADNDLFFRTAPSDARQGEVVADILQSKGYKTAAMTYTNNDYGKGLADSIKSNYESRGGTITISAAHEDGKGDYGAESSRTGAGWRRDSDRGRLSGSGRQGHYSGLSGCRCL